MHIAGNKKSIGRWKEISSIAEEASRRMDILQLTGHLFNYTTSSQSAETNSSMEIFYDEKKRNIVNRSIDDIPNAFKCPITRIIMTDPVIATDGYSYERSAIRNWFRSKEIVVSPVTGRRIVNLLLIPNHNLRDIISEYIGSYSRLN